MQHYLNFSGWCVVYFIFVSNRLLLMLVSAMVNIVAILFMFPGLARSVLLGLLLSSLSFLLCRLLQTTIVGNTTSAYLKLTQIRSRGEWFWVDICHSYWKGQICNHHYHLYVSLIIFVCWVEPLSLSLPLPLPWTRSSCGFRFSLFIIIFFFIAFTYVIM